MRYTKLYLPVGKTQTLTVQPRDIRGAILPASSLEDLRVVLLTKKGHPLKRASAGNLRITEAHGVITISPEILHHEKNAGLIQRFEVSAKGVFPYRFLVFIIPEQCDSGATQSGTVEDNDLSSLITVETHAVARECICSTGFGMNLSCPVHGPKS